MAIQKNNFPFKGLSVEVFEGNETEQASIKFNQNEVNKEFYIDGFKTSKGAQEVLVNYNKFIKDSEGTVLNQDISQSFVATKQENTSYFYNLPAEKLGLKIDQMCVNGLLLELLGVICFHPENGMFLPPISANVEITNATFSEIEAPENPEKPERPEEIGGIKMPPMQLPPEIQYNKNGQIKVTPVDIIGKPSYNIMGTEITNKTGLFKNLEAGEYKIMVTSDAAEMPLIISAKIESIPE